MKDYSNLWKANIDMTEKVVKIRINRWKDAFPSTIALHNFSVLISFFYYSFWILLTDYTIHFQKISSWYTWSNNLRSSCQLRNSIFLYFAKKNLSSKAIGSDRRNWNLKNSMSLPVSVRFSCCEIRFRLIVVKNSSKSIWFCYQEEHKHVS